ncbi:MAG: hydrogenase formation protein HypD [Candidatus Omnitrophota bacterium]
MKYVDEFRNRKLINGISEKIKAIMPKRIINLMEVCGTHTQSFFRFGLDELLPQNLRLISGPGCPVCVSGQEFIDSAIELSSQRDIIIVTFGDMLRVPGTGSSLEKERARGAKVFIVYSAAEALDIARKNPDKKAVFLAVGFETTAPTIALTILAAKKERLKNLYFLSALKVIPPAMEYLLQDKDLRLDGFLCPGHVSAIIGTKAYEFIPKKYKIPCCVAGFEPLDILKGIYLLLENILEGSPRVTNEYARVVEKQGNLEAQRILREVFRATDAAWRGLGVIPGSGLAIRKEFANFDAEKVFDIKQANRRTGKHATLCRCGDVLKGLITPKACPLFAKACKPDNPIGPCMVSSEGSCSAYYKYRR